MLGLGPTLQLPCAFHCPRPVVQAILVNWPHGLCVTPTCLVVRRQPDCKFYASKASHRLEYPGGSVCSAPRVKGVVSNRTAGPTPPSLLVCCALKQQAGLSARCLDALGVWNGRVQSCVKSMDSGLCTSQLQSHSPSQFDRFAHFKRTMLKTEVLKVQLAKGSLTTITWKPSVVPVQGVRSKHTVCRANVVDEVHFSLQISSVHRGHSAVRVLPAGMCLADTGFCEVCTRNAGTCSSYFVRMVQLESCKCSCRLHLKISPRITGCEANGVRVAGPSCKG